MAQSGDARPEKGAAKATATPRVNPGPVVDARGAPPRPGGLLSSLLPGAATTATATTAATTPPVLPPLDLHPAQAALVRVLQAEVAIRAVEQARTQSAAAALRLLGDAEPILLEAIRAISLVVATVTPATEADQQALALLRTFLQQVQTDRPDALFGAATLTELRLTLEQLLESLGLTIPDAGASTARKGDKAWTQDGSPIGSGGGRLKLVLLVAAGLFAAVFLLFTVFLSQ